MFKKSFIPLLAGAALVSAIAYIAPPVIRTAIAAQKGWVLSVAFSPDGQYLYGGGEDKTIKIWDLSK